MDPDDGAILSALKFLCGENDNICRLCLGSVEEAAVFIDDSITITRPYLDVTVTYFEMLEELRVSKEHSLPSKLCNDCATTVTNTYLFSKLYDYSVKTWSDLLEQLTKSINQMQTDLSNPNIKAMYLLLNKSDNVIFTSRQNHSTKSKKNVLLNIKKMQKKRNAQSKKKQIYVIKCSECNATFSSHIMLGKHNVNVHNKISNSCPYCPRIFYSSMQLEEHVKKIHSPKTLQCLKCNKMFSTEKLLKHHDKYYHTAAICKLCFVQFPSKRTLRAHLDKHDLNKCPRCNKILSNKNSFKTHLKQCGNLEEKAQKFFCDICGKGYVRKNGIRSHLKTDHGFGHLFCCKWCGKKFDAISKLKNHVVKHTKEKNFYCEQCGNKFVTHAALIYHVRLHTGERPFPCELCDESFLSASRRMEHKRRKHFGPTKACPVCPMKFITSSQLKKHVERHYNPHSKLYCPNTDESQQIAISTIIVL